MTRFVASSGSANPARGRNPAAFVPGLAPAAAAATVVGIALLLGCPRSDQPTEASVLEADRAFAAATTAEGVDGWVRAFAADGRQLSGAAVVEGPDAIRAAMAPHFADPSFSLTWSPEGARLSEDGSLGYSWGRYTTRRGTAEENGRYLTIWRWQAGQGWRVEADIGSPAP